MMRGNNVYKQVGAVLSAITQHQLWPADLILLTGDIIDEKQHSAFQAAYQDLAERLADLAVQICAIPGNHDHPALLNDIFAKYGMTTRGNIQLGNWLIALLDSSIPCEVGGKLKRAELDSLDTAYRSSHAEHLLAAVHHPLIDIGTHWLDQIRSKNGELLLEQFDGYQGTKMVLWGHAHQEFDQHVKDVRLLGTPAACPVQFKPDSHDFAIDEQRSAGYRWCLLNDNGSIETRVERVE